MPQVQHPTRRLRLLRRALLCVAVLLLSVAALTAASADHLCRPLLDRIARHAGRSVEVAGSLQCHLLTTHPHIDAERVTLSNPWWMPTGVMARIAHLQLDLVIPGQIHWFRIDRLVMQGAQLDLSRDEHGLSNWQLQRDGPGGGSRPLIRSLSMPDARTLFDDQRRHLHFEGQVTAGDGAADAPWFQIHGAGILNGSVMQFAVLSDPLSSATTERGYRFTFVERTHAAQLRAHGMLAHAFTFGHLEADFEASGDNLKAFTLMTGVPLIATGPFLASGHFTRDGHVTRADHLQLTSGSSDVSGNIVSNSSAPRPQLDVQLSSKHSRWTDFGQRAAAPSSGPVATALLLSEVPLNSSALRHADANVQIRIQQLDTSWLTLQQVAAQMKIQDGVVTVAPFTAQLLDGRWQAQLRLDTRQDDPDDTLQMQFSNLQIAALDRNARGPPRFEGTLEANVDLTGHGNSVHQFGAHANGQITAHLGHGTLRASLAELAGLDLRALGLLLSRSRRETAIRCGAVRMVAHDGTLSVQDLFVDTDDILLTGDGGIQLDTEAVDVRLRGHPKQTRILHVAAPLELGGTLRHPSFGLLEPRSLHLLDRSEVTDVDCGMPGR
jgi:AsmA family protein